MALELHPLHLTQDVLRASTTSSNPPPPPPKLSGPLCISSVKGHCWCCGALPDGYVLKIKPVTAHRQFLIADRKCMIAYRE